MEASSPGKRCRKTLPAVDAATRCSTGTAKVLTKAVQEAYLHPSPAKTAAESSDFWDAAVALDLEGDHCQSNGVSVTFQNVAFAVKAGTKDEQVILAPVSGHLEAGSLVAVMGPSGCGKTTLLDILAKKKSSPHEGVVHLNGRPRDEFFHRIAAYVAQEDVLPSYLTVQEVVTFHHLLKQGRSPRHSSDVTLRCVQTCLADLGLSDVQKTLIGDRQARGISGGQRRRVSLACGLATVPNVLFCDEPTSGLSATDAESVTRYLRRIAHRYCVTIVVVIHQPRWEVGQQFDHLLLLTARPGRCVYNGPMKDLRTYCLTLGYNIPEGANPTDFAMDFITPDGVKAAADDFCRHYDSDMRLQVDAIVAQELWKQDCPASGTCTGPPATRYGAGFPSQLRMVGGRQLVLLFRGSGGALADLLVSVGKGIILALTYYHLGSGGALAHLNFTFMLMMAASIDGLKGIPKLVAERKVMKMETSEMLYREWAYIIPSAVISWLQGVASNTIFVLVIFCIADLPWPLFGSLWWWTTMLYLTMDSMFLMLAAVAKDASAAMVLAMPFFMLFLLFNGFTVSRPTAPWYLEWIVNLSPVAYAIEQATMAFARFYDTIEAQMIVELFGYKDEPGTALGVMVAVMLGFRLTQAVALKFFNNIQR